MSEKDLVKLDGEDSVILNKQGWFLVTYYQSRKGSDGSNAYNRAVEKAESIDRKTGIRKVEKEDYTVFEIWEFWK